MGADLGAGSGNNLSFFLETGHNVDAYDISERMLELCRNKYPEYLENGRLHCIESDIECIYPYERKYDWILSNRVLSHIKNVQGFVQKVSQIIKFGGQCFISDIHPLWNYKYTHYRTEKEDIIIETYKHTIESVINCFIENKFNIVKIKEIESREILKPDGIKLGDYPVFYYLILKYQGNGGM